MNQKGFALTYILVGILVTTLIVVGVYYLGTKEKKISPSTPSQKTNQSTPKQTSEDEGIKEVPSNDEKILYAENGFSFYYPRSLELYQAFAEGNFWRSEYGPENWDKYSLVLRYSDQPFSKLTQGGQFNTYIKVYPEKTKLETIQNLEETPLQLGEKPTKRYIITCGVDCYYQVVRFTSNNKYYELIAKGSDPNLLTKFQNILSSFSFYDANSQEWREYTNRDGHYSIQYPPNATFLEKVSPSVDGVRGYSKNLITIIPQGAGPIEGTFSVSFREIGNTTLDEYLKENECGTIYERKRFVLNGEQAEYQSTACGIVGSSDVYVKHKDLLYIIGATSPEDSILATFKFLN